MSPWQPVRGSLLLRRASFGGSSGLSDAAYSVGYDVTVRAWAPASREVRYQEAPILVFR